MENQFINREKELELILSNIMDWGNPRAIFLEGSGGVGKTRLLREISLRFQKQLAEINQSNIREQNVRIGSLIGIADSDWAMQYIAGCKSMAKELGVELIEADGENSISKMVEKFNWLLAQSPDVIIVDLAKGDELQTAMEGAIQQGIHIVLVSSDIKVQGAIIVEQDDDGLAYETLKQLVSDINGQGKIVVCSSWDLSLFNIRHQQLNHIIDENPGVEVVAKISDANEKNNIDQIVYLGSEEGISDQVEEVLDEHPDVKAFWATTGDYAKSVTKVLTKRARSDIRVYSIDFDNTIRQLMLMPDNSWLFTAASDPNEIGCIMIRVAYQAINGLDDKSVFHVPISKITKEMIREIPHDEDVSRRYIPGWGSSLVGWTVRMKEIHKEYSEKLGRDKSILPASFRSDTLGRNWLVLDIIDFDDIRLQSPKDISLLIAEKIGFEHFEPYMKKLYEIHKKEQKTPTSLTQQRNLANQLFLSSLESISASLRVVILCDSTDVVKLGQGEEALKYLISLSTLLSNVALVVSGRNAIDWYRFFSQKSSTEVASLVKLNPFDDKASNEYFIQLQNKLHLTIDTDIRKKILYLSQGLPIKIDLAAYWLSQGRPMDSIISIELSHLESLSGDELKDYLSKFEKQLVSKFSKIRDNLNRMVLALSWVNPIDVSMCAYLLKISDDDAQQLIFSSRQKTFIKSLPNGQIKLHDRVQDLILQYVLPDDDSRRREYYSELAVVYFKTKLDDLSKRLDLLYQKQDDVNIQKKLFIQRELLAREFRQISFQLLRHTLIIDKDEGVYTYNRLFDRTKSAIYRQSLLELVMPYASLIYLDMDRLYDVKKREVELYLDTGEYQAAAEIAEHFILLSANKSKQRANSLLLLGNAQIRLGNIPDGMASFRQANEICEDSHYLGLLIRAKNALGWAYRLTGHIKSAEIYYESAYDMSLDNDIRDDNFGWILNNLAYITIFQNRQKAVNDANDAVQFWENINDSIGLGAALLVLGIVLYQNDNFSEAEESFDASLEIFQSLALDDWVGQVYAWKGALYLAQKNLDSAESYLRLAQDLEPIHMSAMTLNRLGRVYMARGKWDQAEEFLRDSFSLAHTIPDYVYLLGSLARLIAVAAEKGEYNRLDEFDKELSRLIGPNTFLNFIDHNSVGIALFGLTRLALGQGNIDRAIDYLQSGVDLVIEHGSISRVDPVSRLVHIEKIFTDMDKEDVVYLAKSIHDYARQKQRNNRAYGKVRSTMLDWMKWGEYSRVD